MEFVGEDGDATGWIKLDHILRDDFEPGQTDHFQLDTRDVGLPIIIRISEYVYKAISPLLSAKPLPGLAA